MKFKNLHTIKDKKMKSTKFVIEFKKGEDEHFLYTQVEDPVLKGSISKDALVLALLRLARLVVNLPEEVE